MFFGGTALYSLRIHLLPHARPLFILMIVLKLYFVVYTVCVFFIFYVFDFVCPPFNVSGLFTCVFCARRNRSSSSTMIWYFVVYSPYYKYVVIILYILILVLLPQ